MLLRVAFVEDGEFRREFIVHGEQTLLVSHVTRELGGPPPMPLIRHKTVNK